MKFKYKKKARIILLLSVLILSIVGVMTIPISISLTSNANSDQYTSLNLADDINPWNVPEYLFVYAYNNPWEDYDEDGVANGLEIDWFKTNPFDEDSDGDRMGDLYEIYCGTILGGWQDPVVYNERYAILVGGGRAADDTGANYAAFWNHLVWMYDTLIYGYNYKPENVFVFYTDGNPPNENNMVADNLQYILDGTIESHQNMIDFDATAETFASFFVYGDFIDKITSDDSLFFWTATHGGWIPDHNNEQTIRRTSIRFWNKGSIYDNELHWLLSACDYAQLTICSDICHCGGLLDPGLLSADAEIWEDDSDDELNLNDLPGNVIVMTTTDVRSMTVNTFDSFSHQFIQAITPCSYVIQILTGVTFRHISGFYWKPRYEYFTIKSAPSWEALMDFNAEYELGSFTGSTADISDDGLISMQEAFEFARDNNIYGKAVTGDPEGEIPQYYESSSGLMARTFL